MIGRERVVALIPARAGSKGVPRKNLHPLGGRPLIAWPIRTAQRTPEIDRVIVSTDGDEIADACRALGAEVYRRPDHLAGDRALVADAIRHVIATLRAEGETARYMVLLEPTAPFRLAADVSACLHKLHAERLDSVATFMPAHLNPHRAWSIDAAGRPAPFIPGAVPWLPRQQLPPAWQLNGLVYAFVMDGLTPTTPGLLYGATGAVETDPLRSIDIDTHLDFRIADAILESGLIPDA